MKNFHAIWPEMLSEAVSLTSDEVMLASYYHASIINHDSFESALAFHLASQQFPVISMRRKENPPNIQ